LTIVRRTLNCYTYIERRRQKERRCTIAAKKVTGVRLSDEERARLEKEADDLGITLSEYLRTKINSSSQLERIEGKIDEIKEELKKPKK